jgi:hypothetical protein
MIPIRRLPFSMPLLAALLAIASGLGCTLDRSGLAAVASHCSVDLDDAAICPGGVHSYELSGICMTPQLALYQVTAKASFDEETGKATEWIEAVGVLGGEGTVASVSQCAADPFVEPGHECQGTAFNTDVPHPIHTDVYPLLKAVVSPFALAAVDTTCKPSTPPPPAPPAKQPPPKLKLPPLVIVSPTQGQVFRPGTATFELAVQALFSPPTAVEIEWQIVEGRSSDPYPGPPTQVSWRGLPLTLTIKQGTDKGATYRVRVRPAGRGGAWSPTRTFQVTGDFE